VMNDFDTTDPLVRRLHRARSERHDIAEQLRKKDLEIGQLRLELSQRTECAAPLLPICGGPVPRMSDSGSSGGILEKHLLDVAGRGGLVLAPRRRQ
jgi:hypothetical protein